jgi:uncharacterized protein (DUF1330 family)
MSGVVVVSDGGASYRAVISLLVPRRALLPAGNMRGVTVYVLAQISINDRERYGRYVAGFMPILTRYRGRLLAADESAAVVEGSWPYDKVVLMAFEDRESYEQWASSPEYQDMSTDRVAATDGVVLLVDGIPDHRQSDVGGG